MSDFINDGPIAKPEDLLPEDVVDTDSDVETEDVVNNESFDKDRYGGAPLDPYLLFDRLTNVNKTKVNDVAKYLKGFNKEVIEDNGPYSGQKYFDVFQKIINDSKGSLHQDCVLKLLNLWAVNVPQEHEHFLDCGNSKLLMHGTDSSMVFPILQLGFGQIGWASDSAFFRSGYYFQDCSTKAANFAVAGMYDYQNKADFQEWAQKDGEVFYILFCEVAMGKSCVSEHPIKTFLDTIWKTNDSMTCTGHCFPKTKNTVDTLDGIPLVTAPFKKPPAELLKSSRNRHFYNDYVVRNPDQIKIKFLAECRYHARGPITLPFLLKKMAMRTLTADKSNYKFD